MNPSEIITNYLDDLTDEVVYSHASDIDTVAYVLGIDHNYLSSQVRLHIPWFSEEGSQMLRTVRIKKNYKMKTRTS